MAATNYVSNVQITSPISTVGDGGDKCGSGYCSGVIPTECGTWLGQKDVCCYAIINDLATKGIVNTVSCSQFPELSSGKPDNIGRPNDSSNICSPPSGYVFYIMADSTGNIQTEIVRCVDLSGSADGGDTASNSAAPSSPSSSAAPLSSATSSSPASSSPASTAATSLSSAATDMTASSPPATSATVRSAGSVSVVASSAENGTTSGGASQTTPATSSASPTASGSGTSGSKSTTPGAAATTSSKPNSSHKNGSSLAGFMVGTIFMAMLLGAQL
ncbi:hypothetical protein ABW20_dc0109592 [Dactylellina cionopaga]|nr:hypothetical protein ABW20_dc0109592 [Dactylellina cionopaga]